MSTQPKGIPAPDDVRGALDALVEKVGEEEAAKQAEIARNTLIRILSGRPVHRSTIGWVRSRLGLSVGGVTP